MQESDSPEAVEPSGPVDSLDPARRELAGVLQALQPAASRTSSREVWYRAGVQAGRRRANAWRAVATVMAVAMGLSLARGARPERIVYVWREAPLPSSVATITPPTPLPAPEQSASADSPASTESYLRLCDQISQRGPDGLLRTGVAGGGPPPPRPNGKPADSALPPDWYR